MKKSFIFVLLLTVLTFACSAVFVACDTESADTHTLTHVEATAATCTEDGNTEYWICSDCGKYFSDADATTEISQSDTVIPAAGHSYGEWTTVKDATCTEDGTRERECSVCHEKEQETVSASGHTFSEAWSGDNDHHWHACINCDAVSGKAEHTWDNGVVIKQPTCTEDGVMTYTCTVCEKTKTADIPATGHTFSEDWSGDDNYHWHVCLNCDEVSGKAEHTWVNGVCSVCGAPQPSEGLAFALNSDETAYSVTGIGTCTDTDVVIPSVYNGFPVTSIGGSAFNNNTSITSVVLPDSITSIGSNAFSSCTALTSINILDGVISIGRNAFSSCLSLTSITIPDSVTSIGEWAFYGCASLTSINIPDGVTSIGEDAFYCCSKLIEVYNRSSLDITKGSTENGYVAYYALNVYTNKSEQSYLKTTDDGYIFYDDGETVYLVGYNGTQTELTLSDNFNGKDYQIYDYAFSWCSSLTSVNIPDGVTSIGDYAFSWCSSLTSVNIPDGVTSIGKYAFSGCSSLTSVNIPDGVTSIGKNVFSNCSSLTSMNIPDSVTSIGEFAFNLCSSLTSINIPDGVTSIGKSTFYGCSSLTSITIPDSVTSIGRQAFTSCTAFTSIEIPDSVTSIGDYAFSNCSSLTSVNIPDGVTSIGENVFSYCTSLTSITIPDSVTSIGRQAFTSCTAFTSIEIPDSITSIGSYAFEGCSSLENVYITDIATWCDINFTNEASNPLYYAKMLYLNGELLTELIIPDGVTSIGSYAFMNCTSLTSITIPDSVTSIGDYAFYRCTSLTSTNIPDSVTSIGKSAFRNCSSLTSINIPDSVTFIGQYAFLYCSSLTSVTFENTSGWWVADSSSATSGTDVSSEYLADPATAATYLKSTYYNKYWHRS